MNTNYNTENLYFSVIIPVYNKEKYIVDTVYSVLNQSYKLYEVILIDDGSSDNTLNVLSTINDKKVRIYHKENGGVSSARNFGISNARYEYIAFLDGDDTWKPDFLLEIYNSISKYPNECFFATNYNILRNAEYVKRLLPPDLPDISLIPNYFSLARNYYLICSSAVVIKKQLLEDIGGFNEEINYGEDIDMWIRIMSQKQFVYNTKELATYNMGSLNSTVSNTNRKLSKTLAYHLNLSDYNSESERKFKIFQYNRSLYFYILSGQYKNFLYLISLKPTRYIFGFFLFFLGTLSDIFFKKASYYIKKYTKNDFCINK